MGMMKVQTRICLLLPENNSGNMKKVIGSLQILWRFDLVMF